MKLRTRIRESKVRVRSGIRLVGFLLAVAAGAYLGGVFWLAEIGGVLAAFFTAVTLAEHWNAWRLKRKLPLDIKS